MRLHLTFICACLALAAVGYIERSIVAARQSMHSDASDDKPYDAEVAYIQSSGSQWIDLELDSTIDGFCDFDIRYRLPVSSDPPFGYKYGATARYGMWGVSGGTCIGVNNANYIQIADDTEWHSVLLRNGQYIDIDGVTSTIGTGTVRANIGINLFAVVTSARGATSRTLSKACISHFVLYNVNGEPILDMIPVRFTNEIGVREGAMYDLVGGNLFRNSGSGKFIIGPDL